MIVNSAFVVSAKYSALLYVLLAYMVVHGELALSFTIENVIVPVGLHTFVFLYKITHVNLLFVGVNCCAWYCAVFMKLTLHVFVN